MDATYEHALDIIGCGFMVCDTLLFPDSPIMQIALVEQAVPHGSPFACYVPSREIALASGIQEFRESESDQERYCIFLPDFEQNLEVIYGIYCAAYECVFPYLGKPAPETVCLAIAAHEVRHRYQMSRKPAFFSGQENHDAGMDIARFLIQNMPLCPWYSPKRYAMETDARCVEAMIAHLEYSTVDDRSLVRILTAQPQ